jgi:mannose-6-phosphate isomerase-like protein (cupin superfamily)
MQNSVAEPPDIMEYLYFLSGLKDCCAAYPEGYKNVAENETGRLVEMTLKVGQHDPPHDHAHPLHLMYVVQGGKIKITDWSSGSAGEAHVVEMPAGGAPAILPAGPHQVSNVGETDVKIVFVEARSGKFGETPDMLKSPCDNDPDSYKVLAENDEWFAGMMTMEPGAVDFIHTTATAIIFFTSSRVILRFSSTTWDPI